jgi:hypothetical protein
MTGCSARLKAQIVYEDHPDHPPPCFHLNGCQDPECKEWSTLWTEPDPMDDHNRHVLCHVCECEMFDAPQSLEVPEPRR